MFGSTKKTRIVFGALFALALATASAEAQELKLGANIGNVPWEFQNAKGEFVGFEIDLVNEIGKRLGAKIKVVNIPFNGQFAAVQSGQIDMAVSSMTITPKRLQSVSFAPYRPGQSPLTRTFPTPDQIEEDLKRLQGKVRAVPVSLCVASSTEEIPKSVSIKSSGCSVRTRIFSGLRSR